MSNIEGTLHTIAALLKPGAVFLMLEPNRGFMLESARRLWYRLDRYFEAETEAALDHDHLAAMAGEMFQVLARDRRATVCDRTSLQPASGPALVSILRRALAPALAWACDKPTQRRAAARSEPNRWLRALHTGRGMISPA